MTDHTIFCPPLLRLPIFFLLLSHSTTGQQLPDAREKQVLLRLKSHWKDPPALSSWTNTTFPSSPHCSWTGITCNSTITGSITAISLADQGIAGDIPPFLCGSDELNSLISLDLSNNSISGDFPSRALSRCTSLRRLDLSHNLLVGPLPSDLDRVLPHQLDYLALNGNKLSGEVPAGALGAFTVLQELWLDNNNFTGSIPRDIGSLTNLEVLTLSTNNFMPAPIPNEFAKLTKLTTLFLSGANLVEEIPVWVGTNLTELENLDLSINRLTGFIPDSIWSLKNLKLIYLYYNMLCGEISIPPASALKFMDLGLKEIDLSRNNLTGSIPPEFSTLQNLTHLILHDNRFSGEIPSRIGFLPSLIHIHLSTNNLTGPLPPELGTKSPLWSLEACGNALTGEIPTGLCDGGKLASIQLYDNKFTGKFPSSLANCSTLEDVKICNNRLSGEFPPKMWEINSMHTLMISNNSKLYGELPRRFTSNLIRLKIDGNRFSGKIPSSAESLLIFKASYNNISGELPKDLPNSMPVLQYLLLDGNALSGAIPPSIWEMKSLAIVSLNNNYLTRSILEV